MSGRRQFGENVPRNINSEIAAPFAHHTTLRGYGVKEFNLFGD